MYSHHERIAFLTSLYSLPTRNLYNRFFYYLSMHCSTAIKVNVHYIFHFNLFKIQDLYEFSQLLFYEKKIFAHGETF